jgi:hypothetical protein
MVGAMALTLTKGEKFIAVLLVSHRIAALVSQYTASELHS